MQIQRNSFEYEDLLACGRGELFPEGPQLPLPPMLMFDRISEIAEAGGEYGKGIVRAVLEIKPDLWFFPCHFKGCLLYTSPSPRDRQKSRMPSSA